MSKLIIGFVLGVILTLAVVHLLRNDVVREERRSTGRTSTQEALRSEPRDDTTETLDPAHDQPGHAASRSPRADTESEAGARAPDDAATILARQAAQSPSSSQGSPATIARPSYPPEILDMIENRVDKELQARYENDRREESWATYMEGQLAAYFAQKPLLSQFNISLIDCRTSVCSVHVLGYGMDALTQWNTATADLVSQPWFEFNNMSMNRRNPAPDILAVVLILTKKPAGS